MHSSSSFWLGKGRQNQHHFSCVFGSLPSSHAPPSHLLFKLFCFSFHVESCDERKCHFVPSLQFADFIFCTSLRPFTLMNLLIVCACLCLSACAFVWRREQHQLQEVRARDGHSDAVAHLQAHPRRRGRAPQARPPPAGVALRQEQRASAPDHRVRPPQACPCPGRGPCQAAPAGRVR